MIIRSMETGMLGANCYLVICEETKETVIIDPGDEGERILNRVNEEKAKVIAIINTHGHGDHIGANRFLKEATGAPLMCHENDAPKLVEAGKNLSLYIGVPISSPPPDRFLQEGDIIEIGSTIRLEVLHTPGHTAGGICLKGEGVVFTGDTLFAGSIGRTDFPGGSFEEIIRSINTKLLSLADNTVVYSGHGPTSTIGEEKRSNPFLT
ncbi:MBL fold metallo-hydrolase [Heliobacillus mobilis]|uniref:MBL fold metallo-hydrolase n=1 Tax=Heliobacterium mobile TaxID=28064 RepID=A0A6I3SLC0_HELMO|nr:MBL fold metallo-hydrolase [Heliobacterium mobile]MTV49719.1 MBL fold metallo-hydrolase [Heliobacterium mobile]